MIREAQVNDGSAVYKLMCELEETVFDKSCFQKNYETLLKQEDISMFVYEEDEILAFMCMVFSLQLHHNAWVGEIRELIVDASCRGKKIGHQMFEQAKKTAKERNCVRLELSTNQKRLDAHRFYAREGMNNSHYNFTLDL